jgi:hypothetical protein
VLEPRNAHPLPLSSRRRLNPWATLDHQSRSAESTTRSGRRPRR